MLIPKLIMATNNLHKIREMRRLFSPHVMDLLSPADLGLHVSVDENGRTFSENAILKARAFAEASELIALADDSGIEVDALEGRPGIYSARYGGPGISDRDRMLLLLQEMGPVPWERRYCRYVASLVLAWPDGHHLAVEGYCDGLVAFKPEGANGFGYDPIFFLPKLNKTFAQLSDDQKDQISHRGNASRSLIQLVDQ